MDLAAFNASLDADTVPPGLSQPLRALWHAARGEWDAALTYFDKRRSHMAYAQAEPQAYPSPAERLNPRAPSSNYASSIQAHTGVPAASEGS